MKTIINLIKLWSKETYGDEEKRDEGQIEWLKEVFVDKAKSFLQWLIDNWHIEKIETETKTWPTLNDYIKYIATAEDPIETLSSMIK